MNTRSVTGWLLVCGPIGTFLVIGVLYSMLVGDQETPASSVAEMMAEPSLARLLLGLGSIVFVSSFLGLTLLSHAMRGDDTPGGALASLSTIIFAAVAALAIGATGLSAGALEASATSEAIAVNIEAVSSAMFTGVWLFWGIGSLLLGGAMVMRKNLHAVIAWIFVVFGIFVLVSSLIDLNLADGVGMVVWIAITVVTAAAGVQTLKQNS